jgi:uncharacterized membrane protein YjjB (DUF3815 family)
MAWDGYPQKKWLGHPPEFWIGMILLVVCMFAAVAIGRSSSDPVIRTLAGLAPLVPMLAMMRGYLRMVREQDELYRRVQMEATAIAACITIAFCFGAWFLSTISGLPPVDIQWAGIVLFFSYAITAGVVMRRYA